MAPSTFENSNPPHKARLPTTATDRPNPDAPSDSTSTLRPGGHVSASGSYSAPCSPCRAYQQPVSNQSPMPPRPTKGRPFYSEDISPQKEEDVRHMRWVGFVTLVGQQGGNYRPRVATPAAYGGFSDIWQCDARFFDGSVSVVAVKKLRAVQLPTGLDKPQTTKKLLQRLKRELQIWMRFDHPNVAPLLGFTFNQEIAIISPWFGNGNVSEYLRAHPEVNRLKLVQGVASGLAYLHSSTPVIVHGDVKPDNVLIDKWGGPRIIDFGLSKLVEEDPSLSSLQTTSLRDAGNARWMAPELLFRGGGSRSRQTDMFSLACVAFFILSGDVPFKGILDAQLVIARYEGAHPFLDGVVYPNLGVDAPSMGALQSCLDRDPNARPKIGDVVGCLEGPPLDTVPTPTEPTSRLLNYAAMKRFWTSCRALWRKILRAKGRRG